MRCLIFFLLLGAIIALPASVSALELQYPNIPGFGDLDALVKSGAPLSFPQIIQFIYALALWLAGLVAFAALVYAGFVAAFAVNNPGKLREAQQRLGGIALGLTILFSAFLILRTINPDLTQLSTRTFAICKPAGAVNCSNPFFPTIGDGTGSSSSGGPSTASPFKLFLAKNLRVGPPIFFNPEDLLEVSGDTNLSADWNNKTQYVRMEGNGKATFFDASDYSQDPPPWLELAHHEALGYTCMSGALKSGAPIAIGMCTSFFNAAGNRVPAIDGEFVDLGRFCIDDSCGILGGDRFEDNISSIVFKAAGSDLPSGCPVKGCRMISNFAGHLTRCGEDYGDPQRINCGVDVQSTEGGEKTEVAPSGCWRGDPPVPYNVSVTGEGRGVYATLDGEVRVWNLDMGGIGLDIYNNDRTASVYYSHLRDVVVSSGSTVSRGQLIGHQDRTGNARCTVSHVHYAVIINGMGADPELYSLK